MGRQQTLQVPGYQVVRLIGNGARSSIWEIRKANTDKSFALKRVIRRRPEDARFLEQARGEYEIGRQLEHPNLRGIHELRRVRKLIRLSEIHLLMEFFDGTDLQTRRPEEPLAVAEVFLQAAAALKYMNDKGCVHADIKPNNILVDERAHAMVIDLGQSCPIGTVKPRIQGTPDFIAPEQVRRMPLDARTDVFNFGAALYWTLTGRAIPTALPKAGAVSLSSEMIVTPPEQHNPAVTPPLSKLVMDCVEFQPGNRPQSMGDVKSRLELICHTLRRAAAQPVVEPASEEG